MEVPRVVHIIGPQADWHPVRPNAASLAVERSLDARITELSKAHTAAQTDYMDSLYPQTPPNSVASRIGSVLRRIF
jgi:hypothetical protein